MTSSWYITLERIVNVEEFDQACFEIGFLQNKGLSYDVRTVGEKVLPGLGLGGVDIYFGNGTEEDPLMIKSSASGEKRYEAMKRTALDLAQKLPFSTIGGEWFDDVTELDEEGEPKLLPYTADVFKKIE